MKQNRYIFCKNLSLLMILRLLTQAVACIMKQSLLESRRINILHKSVCYNLYVIAFVLDQQTYIYLSINEMHYNSAFIKGGTQRVRNFGQKYVYLIHMLRFNDNNFFYLTLTLDKDNSFVVEKFLTNIFLTNYI